MLYFDSIDTKMTDNADNQNFSQNLEQIAYICLEITNKIALITDTLESSEIEARKITLAEASKLSK